MVTLNVRLCLLSPHPQAAREEELLLRQNSAESANSKPESESEATSELDVRSQTSDESMVSSQSQSVTI